MARLLLVIITSLFPTLAFAHVGIGVTHGFSQGLLHPLSGIDHILVMGAVGVFAAQVGGRALWFVPLSFLGMMVVGGALGTAGVAVPFVEIGIGLSVVVLGMMIALQLGLPVAAAVALVGLFAVFHGHAHGAEMPDTVSGLGYGLGFVLMTAILHVTGVKLGLLIGKPGASYGKHVRQAAGGAMTLAGAAILTGML